MTLDSGDLKEIAKLLAAATSKGELPYRLGMQLSAVEKIYTNPSQGTLVAPPDANRVVLGFACGGSQCIFSTILQPGATFPGGVNTGNASPPAWLNVASHGTLVQLAWYLVSSSSGNICVYTVTWRPPTGG